MPTAGPIEGSDDPAVLRLVESRDPSVRYLALTELLEAPPTDARVVAAKRAIPKGARVRALLAGQKRDGGFGVHPYRKWTGGFWRFVALAELAVPPDRQRVPRLADHVLRWLEGGPRGLTTGPVLIGTLVRAHATQDGFALAACSLLGLASLARVKHLADRIIEWQWPDGGWNCDPRPHASHSSFHETHGAVWGLAEYGRVTGHHGARRAAKRGAERGADGMWRADGYHWKPPGSAGSNVEVVDWGRGGPSEWVTLRALRVLKAAASSGIFGSAETRS